MMPGHPEVAQLQILQAQELADIDFGERSVVIAGDFNSNATHTPPALSLGHAGARRGGAAKFHRFLQAVRCRAVCLVQ